MSKSELIESIRRFNRSVTAEFLEKFDVRDLQAYLDRICSVAVPSKAQAKHVDAGELIVA